MKRFITLIALVYPLFLHAQHATQQSPEQHWAQEIKTAKDILDLYQQEQKTSTNPETTQQNEYFLLLKSGEYIIQSLGKSEDIALLLKRIPRIDLNDITWNEFIKKWGADRVVDYYFMMQALKQGATFNDARDGISFSTAFLPRALNQWDYTKLKEIFKGDNEYLQNLYLEKTKFIFRNNGCTDGMYALKPIIQKHVPESNLKNEILALYTRYEKIRKGQPAPTPTLKDANGKEYSFKDFKGKVIVADIWATWCCSCIEKMPEFMQLKEELRDNPNVIFLSVSIDREHAHAKWLKALEDNHMTGMLNFITGCTEESLFETAYCIPSVPRHLVIDQDGKIVDAFAPKSNEELKNLIIKTLQK